MNHIFTSAAMSAVIVAAGASVALSGCANNQIVATEGNYIKYVHPFTETAAAEVRRNAERMCEQRKQVALKTESACSLSKCATSYQCVDQANAAALTR